MTFRIGDTSTKPYLFDEAGIMAFAHGAGDCNPLHHDHDEAAKSRFKVIIASGAHMTAVLTGFGATMLTTNHDSLGLEFTFRFERAIPAGTQTNLTWVITGLEPNAKLGGTIVLCEGAITGEDGKRYVSANGKAVVWDKPPAA
ncbi:MAG: MaoC/PaaZ C-terminal domain-containing protein [Hyphomicrobiaceae bacterium]